MFLLNVEIINQNNSTFLRSLEKICLKPIGYLFNGRTIEILNGVIIKDELSFDNRSYLKVALAISFLVPGFIWGIAARLLNNFNFQYVKDYKITKQFVERKISLPIVPTDVSFTTYQETFLKRMDAILNQIQGDEKIWKKQPFIKDFSEVMNMGYIYMALYFQQLSQECNNDPKLMKEKMILQPQNQKMGEQDYCHPFFHFSQLYHYARGCASQANRDKYAAVMGIAKHEPMPLIGKKVLMKEDQEVYFNPTKPQYRWKELYNAFCALVDKNGLRRALKAAGGDKRFSNWSRPDMYKVSSYHSPDTLPT